MKIDKRTIKNSFVLLRIPFSIYLLPIYLFALSQTPTVDWDNAMAIFILLHLMVYPASNGYNSLMDKDTDSIGGLENPPLPDQLLFWVTLALDISAIGYSLFNLSLVFTVLMTSYIVMSRAYSFTGIRLKKYPIPGFLTVFIFQGFWTFWMVVVGITSTPINFWSSHLLLPAIASSFMIGGAYPLSQIYQHKQDQESGDTSMSMLLGIKGTFIFSIISFNIAGILLFYYFNILNHGSFITYFIFLVPLLTWFNIWMKRTFQNEKEASFHNLMKMNNISAICMNLCYLVFILQNHFNLLQF